MAKTKFNDKEIKDGMILLCNTAVDLCGKKFQKHKAVKKQGLERLFEEDFVKAAKMKDWKIKTQHNRADLGIIDKMRPKGWVDAIITHDDGFRVGVEFKICELPRMKWNDANSSTYDVGQLAWDYKALSTYKMDSAYCVAVLHGALVEMPTATPLGIMRMFHNALFTDFQVAKSWGWAKYKNQSAIGRREIETISDMGLDKPFYRPKANPNNFCRLYKEQKLAVVGFSIR